MKKIVLAIIILLVALFAISAIRAVTTFKDLQVVPADGINAISIDESAAIDHFSAALKIQTISHDDRSNFNAGAFIAFHDFLEQAYPLVNQMTRRTVDNDDSLVYHLRGTNPVLEQLLSENILPERAIHFYHHLIRRSMGA